ncbi:Thylakoid lumenal 17.4 kDa protein, chloroplastic [Ananas comosus]|uniref:Thylakoid lumenal 17.4 kDa protein, chloroplastic n=1 Tax=Ananas comosus TaxID=4615 RepID=A0A199V6T2_ANACO|nr:Thylakoid lumenal 17.4 kDa protein, chloroplastic [Ananas comosus]
MGKWRVEYEEEEEEEEKYSNKKSATNQLKMASFCVPGAGSSLRPSLSSSAPRIPLSRPRNRIQCASIEERSSGLEESAAAAAASSSKGMRSFACGLLAAWAITAASPAAAANQGKSLAAALMSDAKFDGVDFTNAVIDRVNFEKADLQGAIFKNTVLSGSTFNDANLKDAVFEDTIIGYIDLQKLCTNTTISAEGRAELGCR